MDTSSFRIIIWIPTVPNIDEYSRIICPVRSWKTDQVGRHDVPSPRYVQLVATRVKLGTIHSPSRMESDNLVTNKIITWFETGGDGVVVSTVVGKHEWGLTFNIRVGQFLSDSRLSR